MKFIPAVLSCALLLASSQAMAWGHLKDFEEPDHGKGHLVYAVLNQHRVNFAIVIEPGLESRFSDASIEAQVRMALKLWIQPVINIVNAQVTIHREVASPTTDVVISFQHHSVYLDEGFIQVMLSHTPQTSQSTIIVNGT